MGFRKHLSFSQNELSGMIVAALFLGFMFSFRDWGVKDPDITAGLVSLAVAVILSLIVLWAHFLGQKLVGLSLGYAASWGMELRGLLTSLLFCFLSNGYLVLPLFGSIRLEPVQELRFGRRPGFRFYHLGWTAVSGCIANLFLALIARLAWAIYPMEALGTFAMMNVLVAGTMSVPLPFSNGIHLLFAARLDYVAYLATVMFFSILLATPLGLGWILGLTALFALCAWIGYWLVEKNLK